MPTPNVTRNQVAARTAEGQTARQIATALDLSTQAVYYHLNRLQANEAGTGDDPERSRSK